MPWPCHRRYVTSLKNVLLPITGRTAAADIIQRTDAPLMKTRARCRCYGTGRPKPMSSMKNVPAPP